MKFFFLLWCFYKAFELLNFVAQIVNINPYSHPRQFLFARNISAFPDIQNYKKCPKTILIFYTNTVGAA
jgi:hypothetical protein